MSITAPTNIHYVYAFSLHNNLRRFVLGSIHIRNEVMIDTIFSDENPFLIPQNMVHLFKMEILDYQIYLHNINRYPPME